MIRNPGRPEYGRFVFEQKCFDTKTQKFQYEPLKTNDCIALWNDRLKHMVEESFVEKLANGLIDAQCLADPTAKIALKTQVKNLMLFICAIFHAWKSCL